jgi:hypothetical protein
LLQLIHLTFHLTIPSLVRTLVVYRDKIPLGSNYEARFLSPTATEQLIAAIIMVSSQSQAQPSSEEEKSPKAKRECRNWAAPATGGREQAQKESDDWFDGLCDEDKNRLSWHANVRKFASRLRFYEADLSLSRSPSLACSMYPRLSRPFAD